MDHQLEPVKMFDFVATLLLKDRTKYDFFEEALRSGTFGDLILGVWKEGDRASIYQLSTPDDFRAIAKIKHETRDSNIRLVTLAVAEFQEYMEINRIYALGLAAEARDQSALSNGEKPEDGDERASPAGADRPIEELKLSPALTKKYKEAGFTTIGSLLHMTAIQFDGIPGVRYMALRKTNTALKNYGFLHDSQSWPIKPQPLAGTHPEEDDEEEDFGALGKALREALLKDETDLGLSSDEDGD